MKSKLLAVFVLLASAALVYFAFPAAPEVNLEPEVTEAVHADHEADPTQPIASVNLAVPTNGLLCNGTLSVNVPGDEQQFPERFTVQFPATANDAALIDGLWPSPQFLPELEPPFWELLRDFSSSSLTINGIGLTEATSLTARIALDTDARTYQIFWSVLPVGFRTPVEFWSSEGRCDVFGDAVTR
ncbi:MAG: hypothetical protein ACI80M_000033 [Gammaproteobacteria bacterium]|jgi:hypothetical protein